MKIPFLSLLLCVLVPPVWLSPAPAWSAGASKASIPTKSAPAAQSAMFGMWATHSLDEKGGTTCYMSLRPIKPAPWKVKGKRRGSTYVMITHRPVEGSLNVVSVTAGYTFKSGSEAIIQFDSKKDMRLFTEGDTAWTRDSAADRDLAKLVRTSKTMTIKGHSIHGDILSDSYDLTGAMAAWKSISKRCGVKE
ncbi:MAG: hypothetical protein IPI58_05025 [Alphaproteobacteria bacterium]|nr:MAG: hypothetical protein IPI58_05025 [Alphaproteobacteria bacterium]